ncbi:hypothetical protein G4B88_023915 [Cannabis sativa]|uniref:Uncharacterized protein n=1 Tax=Cannabis sativa TaxID=3483 RepID=A0A7J6EVP5_CANSA|nr:hypothetical protein G4B88_023915 [Cannabis sativa]
MEYTIVVVEIADSPATCPRTLTIIQADFIEASLESFEQGTHCRELNLPTFDWKYSHGVDNTSTQAFWKESILRGYVIRKSTCSLQERHICALPQQHLHNGQPPPEEKKTPLKLVRIGSTIHRGSSTFNGNRGKTNIKGKYKLKLGSSPSSIASFHLENKVKLRGCIVVLYYDRTLKNIRIRDSFQTVYFQFLSQKHKFTKGDKSQGKVITYRTIV